jgi:hypothetical protein
MSESVSWIKSVHTGCVYCVQCLIHGLVPNGVHVKVIAMVATRVGLDVLKYSD